MGSRVIAQAGEHLLGSAERCRRGAVNMALPDVLIALTACERRGDFLRPCGASYVNPLGAR